MHETEITVSIDTSSIPKNIGFERNDGKIVYTVNHVNAIKEWLDGKFNIVPAIDKKIVVHVTGPMPEWMAFYLGQYLDSKADVLILTTPQLPGWIVKGAN